jgi:hypothetical protein
MYDGLVELHCAHWLQQVAGALRCQLASYMHGFLLLVDSGQPNRNTAT